MVFFSWQPSVKVEGRVNPRLQWKFQKSSMKMWDVTSSQDGHDRKACRLPGDFYLILKWHSSHLKGLLVPLKPLSLISDVLLSFLYVCLKFVFPDKPKIAFLAFKICTGVHLVCMYQSCISLESKMALFTLERYFVSLCVCESCVYGQT